MPDRRPPPSPPVTRRDPSRPDPAFWGVDRLGRTHHRSGSRLDRTRDQLERWRGDGRVGVAALVLVAVLVGLVWYRVGASGAGGAPPARPAAARAAPATTLASTGTAGSSSSGSSITTTKGRVAGVVVHVAGAVVHPGVVELPVGSRVIDAIEAVGGAFADADLDRLNLAAKLVDGQRIAVARVGDAAVPTASSSAAGGAADGSLVDLNTATQTQLEALPGIGPQLATEIITERDRRGGFRSVNELRSVHGIGDKRFADLKSRVTV